MINVNVKVKLLTVSALRNFRRKNQWLHNCNLASGIVSDKKPPHLCELHFEKINFTAERDLKSNSVPTLFGRIEGL